MRDVWCGRSFFVAAALLLIAGLLAPLGGWATSEAFESPMIWVIPEDDDVYGHGWTPGSTVTVTVDDTDFEASAVVFTGWGEHDWLGRGDFDLGPAEFDFQAGQTVRVTSDDDPAVQKVHTVTALQVTDVDPVGGTVAGTTDSVAGSLVEVVLHDAPVRRLAEVEADGAWLVDFSTAVDDGGEGWGSSFDLQQSFGGHASEYDVHGDATSVNWRMAGTVVVNKVVEGLGPTERFVFALICTLDGQPGTDLDLYAAAGGSDSAEVVAGEVCTVEEFAIQIGDGTDDEDRGPIETDDVRWDVDPSPPGFEGEGRKTGPFTVVANTTVNIMFTNTYPPVALDVPSGHPFVTEIGWMVAERITTGFPDDTFRPTQPVTRQAAAAFLYRLAGEPPVAGVAGFSDVPNDHPFHDEIAWMVTEGITTGFDDNTFRPASPVTRQAAAAFLYRASAE